MSLLAVALLMVALPALYVALVAGLAAASGWYAFAAPDFLPATGSARVRLFLYVAPIVVGAVTSLFLLKPLLARPAKSTERRGLSRELEPRLFAFLDELADAVGAPKPARVVVDLDVNAYAALRSPLKGDLTLCLGLPLVAGLDARGLASVVAHEYGHFSQGLAMRAYWIIVTVRGWFARVVHGRDAWDERLEAASERTDFIGQRLLPLVWSARGMIWLSRRILALLMRVGDLATANLSRQMEFDADAHAVGVAGSDVFARTLPELTVLDTARDHADHDLQMAWREGRLPDDLVALAMGNVEQFSEAEREALRTRALDSAPSLYASHPPSRQRIERARALARESGVAIDGPATGLFQDFDALARKITGDQHRAVLGDGFDPASLTPSAEVLRVGNERADERRARAWLFGEGFRLPEVPAALEAAPTADEPPDAEARYGAEEVERRRLAGHVLREVGLKFDPAKLELHNGEPLLDRAARRERDETRCAHVAAEAARIWADVDDLLGDGAPELVEFVRAVAAAGPELCELDRAFDVIDRVYGALTDEPEDAAAADRQLRRVADDLRAACTAVGGALGSLAAPAAVSADHTWPAGVDVEALPLRELMGFVQGSWSTLEQTYEEALGALALRVRQAAAGGADRATAA